MHLANIYRTSTACPSASAEMQACGIFIMLRFMQRIKREWYDISDWQLNLENIQGKPLQGVN